VKALPAPAARPPFGCGPRRDRGGHDHGFGHRETETAKGFRPWNCKRP